MNSKNTEQINDLLQLDVQELRAKLSQANDEISQYMQDKQVVVKEIEHDMKVLTANFNSKTRKIRKAKKIK